MNEWFCSWQADQSILFLPEISNSTPPFSDVAPIAEFMQVFAGIHVKLLYLMVKVIVQSARFVDGFLLQQARLIGIHLMWTWGNYSPRTYSSIYSAVVLQYRPSALSPNIFKYMSTETAMVGRCALQQENMFNGFHGLHFPSMRTLNSFSVATVHLRPKSNTTAATETSTVTDQIPGPLTLDRKVDPG